MDVPLTLFQLGSEDYPHLLVLLLAIFLHLPASHWYTQSVFIRNGPIRSSSEILAFFKKSPVELSKLRNGEITFQIFKKCTSESFQFKKWSQTYQRRRH